MRNSNELKINWTEMANLVNEKFDRNKTGKMAGLLFTNIIFLYSILTKLSIAQHYKRVIKSQKSIWTIGKYLSQIVSFQHIVHN